MKSYIIVLLSILCLHPFISKAQLSIDNLDTEYKIDFENTISNVNNGTFDGSGFANSASVGQLDADAWSIEGASDGDKDYGIENSSGDYARGSNNSGVGTGGIYAFEVENNNFSIGFQATGSDFTPGSIALKLENNTGEMIRGLSVSYTVWTYNDQNKSNSCNFSHGTSSNTSDSEPTINHSTATSKDDNPEWVSVNKNITLDYLYLLDGWDYYLKWSTDEISGSGSLDQIAIDNIKVYAYGSGFTTCVDEEFSDIFTTYEIAEGWEQNGFVDGDYYTDSDRYTSPPYSMKFKDDNDQLTTPLVENMLDISFWMERDPGPFTPTMLIETFDGTSWNVLENITNLNSNGEYYVYNFNTSPALLPNQKRVRFTYTKNGGFTAFDDVEIICEAGCVKSNPTAASTFTQGNTDYDKIEFSLSSGNGDNQIIFLSDAAITASPVDNTIYYSEDYGDGSELSADVFTVYKSTYDNTQTLEALEPGTKYHYRLFDYNCDLGKEKYSSTYTEGVIATKPNSADNFDVVCHNSNSILLSWEAPENEAIDGFLVVGRQSTNTPSVTARNHNPHHYTANSNWNLATEYSAGTQSKVLYCGSDTSINITQLSYNLDYSFQIYFYIGGTIDTVYSNSVTEYSTTTVENASNFAASALDEASDLSWLNPTDNSCYQSIQIIADTDNDIQTPNISYSANSTFGSGDITAQGGYVVYNGTNETVSLSNLTNGTTYYLNLFVYDGYQWSTGVQISVTPDNLHLFEKVK